MKRPKYDWIQWATVKAKDAGQLEIRRAFRNWVARACCIAALESGLLTLVSAVEDMEPLKRVVVRNSDWSVR